MNPKPGYLLPDWPAPDNIRALSSTRDGGVSLEPYSAANLALHVGDCEAHVRENRRRLMAAASLPAEPQWLEQVHGNKVVRARDDGRILTADACYTDRRGLPCAVLTADCLPVLLCNRTGTQVAAVHAGWRSLAAGILRKTVATFPEGGGEILAWLGPAIGPARFEVGVEVLEAFFASAIDSDHTEMMASAFTAGQRPMRFLADLYTLARAELKGVGVERVFGGNFCTYEQADQFFSYRRDGQKTGRMASIIWMV